MLDWIQLLIPKRLKLEKKIIIYLLAYLFTVEYQSETILFISLHVFSNTCPIFVLPQATRAAVKRLLVLRTTVTILENNKNNLLPHAKKNVL